MEISEYPVELKRVLKQYKYSEVINQEDLLPDFKDDYSFFANKDDLKNNPNAVYAVLHYVPNCHHIAAKNQFDDTISRVDLSKRLYTFHIKPPVT